MKCIVAVAAILAGATYCGGNTEFDKAADFWVIRLERSITNLVASHPVLLHLLKLALQLRLALHLLLGAADVDEPAVHLLSIHLVYCLQARQMERRS